ncbi:MAG: STAS domain-containing protein [Sulfuricurvum sp.]|jgi:ABC-type transporter Mla MlaB component
MVTMDGSSLRFSPVGELTIYQVEEALKQLTYSFGNAKDVWIDLSRIDKIDTAGFQLLISLSKSCKVTDKKCNADGVCESVENFMALFGYEFDAEYKGAL